MLCWRDCLRAASRCFCSACCSADTRRSSAASLGCSSLPDLRSWRCLLFSDCNVNPPYSNRARRTN